MSDNTETILNELKARPGEWVSSNALATAMYGEEHCDHAVANRLKQAIFYARRTLPKGLVIETGHGLGYRIVGAGAVE